MGNIHTVGPNEALIVSGKPVKMIKIIFEFKNRYFVSQRKYILLSKSSRTTKFIIFLLFCYAQ